jgi:DNA-binding MarR family transcriptional regulator
VESDGSDDAGALDAAELRVWRGLIETSAVLRHRLDRLLLADSGLSGSDYPVLVRLSEAADQVIRSSELAEGIGWERSRLSHQLARMERRGLVERRRHDADSRGSEVRLTAQGRATYLGATKAHSRAVRTHFADVLSDDQINALGEIMDTLARHLAAPPDALG